MLGVQDGVELTFRVGDTRHVLHLSILLDGLDVRGVPLDACHQAHHGSSDSQREAWLSMGLVM